MEINQKNDDEAKAAYRSNDNASKFSSVTLQGPVIHTDQFKPIRNIEVEIENGRTQHNVVEKSSIPRVLRTKTKATKAPLPARKAEISQKRNSHAGKSSDISVKDQPLTVSQLSATEVQDQ